jgi:hypothetical protein
MSVTDSRRQPRRRGEPPGERGHPRPPTDDPADDSLLPPGRRDGDGFWIPDGCEDPEALFSPHQRRLQEKQRRAHRARRGGARGDDPTDAKPAAEPAGKAVPPRAPRVDSPRGSD